MFSVYPSCYWCSAHCNIGPFQCFKNFHGGWNIETWAHLFWCFHFFQHQDCCFWLVVLHAFSHSDPMSPYCIDACAAFTVLEYEFEYHNSLFLRSSHSHTSLSDAFLYITHAPSPHICDPFTLVDQSKVALLPPSSNWFHMSKFKYSQLVCELVWKHILSVTTGICVNTTSSSARFWIGCDYTWLNVAGQLTIIVGTA